MPILLSTAFLILLLALLALVATCLALGFFFMVAFMRAPTHRQAANIAANPLFSFS